MNSENVYVRLRVPKLIAACFLVLSGLGFIDATYLSVEHWSAVVPPCSLAGGCEVVLTSRYATVGSVPIALFGAIYYLAVFLLAYGYFDSGRLAWLRLASWLAVLGFAVSLVLVYLQFFVLRALCQYCLLSAGISTGLFLLGLLVLKVGQRAVERPLVVGQSSGDNRRD